MSRRSDRLHAPWLAALLLSAVAHAAIVVATASREPAGAPIAAQSTSTMRAKLALSPAASAPAPSLAPPTLSSPERSAAPATAAPPREARAPRPAATARVEDPHPTVSEDASDVRLDQGPKPLTYPVISLPPNDDPRRVGLVRLMLVVSSEGRVVKTVVTGATLSQDYVDRISESFAAVRFAPAIAQGMPRASWYEVVVDLTFDPEARSPV